MDEYMNSFALKLYGRPYDKLSSKEKMEVQAMMMY